jgi:8-oxo-dGTP diphosphatase
MENKKRPKVGIGVFVIKGNKFLIGKRINPHGPNNWSLTGGHLELFETFEECAKRETLEESNLIIDNVKVIGITNNFYKKTNDHYVTVFVKSNYISGKANVNEKDRFLEWKWVSLEELPKDLFLPLESFLKQNKDLNQKLFYSS